MRVVLGVIGLFSCFDVRVCRFSRVTINQRESLTHPEKLQRQATK